VSIYWGAATVANTDRIEDDDFLTERIPSGQSRAGRRMWRSYLSVVRLSLELVAKKNVCQKKKDVIPRL
jgi:hypothetical protein